MKKDGRKVWHGHFRGHGYGQLFLLRYLIRFDPSSMNIIRSNAKKSCTEYDWTRTCAVFSYFAGPGKSEMGGSRRTKAWTARSPKGGFATYQYPIRPLGIFVFNEHVNARDAVSESR